MRVELFVTLIGQNVLMSSGVIRYLLRKRALVNVFHADMRFRAAADLDGDRNFDREGLSAYRGSFTLPVSFFGFA